MDRGALDTIFDFVRRVVSFGINVVIDGIAQFGKLVLFLKDRSDLFRHKG